VKRSNTLMALFLVLACIGWAGCTRHVKPDKFEVSQAEMLKFSGGAPLKVVVPQDAEREFPVQFTRESSAAAKVFVDLNDMYQITREHIEETLQKRQVPVLSDAPRFLKFTIDKMQWEVWAGGFSIGAYMDFTIETSDGYTKKYQVQDGSAADVSRSIGGLPSRAVEKIFQDQEISNFIRVR
jgi:hypothetical protein